MNLPSIVGVLGIMGCGGTQGVGIGFCATCSDCFGDVDLGFRFFFLFFLGVLCQNGFIAAPLSAFLGQTNPCDALIQISGDPDLNARGKFGIDAADSTRLSRDSEII